MLLIALTPLMKGCRRIVTIKYYPFFTECGPLQDPQHGCVSLTGNSYGSVAKYKCSSGYELEGNQQRYCMKDGQWNGTDATCKIIGESQMKTCYHYENTPM